MLATRASLAIVANLVQGRLGKASASREGFCDRGRSLGGCLVRFREGWDRAIAARRDWRVRGIHLVFIILLGPIRLWLGSQGGRSAQAAGHVLPNRLLTKITTGQVNMHWYIIPKLKKGSYLDVVKISRTTQKLHDSVPFGPS